MTPESKPILLYDGVCGLCNGLTKFLLKRDTEDRLLFASLQSEFAKVVLARHGMNAADLDTVYLVLDNEQPNERLLSRSDAILYSVATLKGLWHLIQIGRIVPRFVRDRLYSLVAQNRYRVFGKHESCMLPPAKDRKKFLDI